MTHGIKPRNRFLPQITSLLIGNRLGIAIHLRRQLLCRHIRADHRKPLRNPPAQQLLISCCRCPARQIRNLSSHHLSLTGQHTQHAARPAKHMPHTLTRQLHTAHRTAIQTAIRRQPQLPLLLLRHRPDLHILGDNIPVQMLHQSSLGTRHTQHVNLVPRWQCQHITVRQHPRLHIHKKCFHRSPRRQITDHIRAEIVQKPGPIPTGHQNSPKPQAC